MSSKRYFSKSDMERKERRFDELEYFNDFAKLGITRMHEKKLDLILEKHIEEILFKHSNRTFLNLMQFQDRYTKMKSNSGYKEIRKNLIKLQNSLLKMMSEIREALKNNRYELWTFTGKVRLYFDTETKKYEILYVPKKLDDTGEVDIETECKMLTSRYFQVISYLCQEMPRERLKICEKCEAPFFQATAREKIYCSVKCTNAAAQIQFTERKTQGGEEN